MSNCVCGSGLASEFCCIPRSYPIADAENGWRNLNVQLHGVDVFGRLVPVPSDLTATLTINQLHHVDPCVQDALRVWTEVVGEKVKLMPPDTMLKALNSVSALESNLSDSLTATRYHQRQFLCRFNAVNVRHGQACAQGSEQLQIVFQDLPLKCELEAFLVRATGSLDALAQMIGLILTGKQRTFGVLIQKLETKGTTGAELRKELSSIFKKHSAWITESKRYRNAIVHEAEFDKFQAPKLSTHGISSACVAEDDADAFIIRVWANLLQMVREVGTSMHRHSADWRLPII
jgi:hypothetical protein